MLQMIFREGFLSICIGIREIVYSMFRRMCVSYTDASLEHRFLSNIGSLRGSNRIRGCREIGTKWNQSEGGTEIGGRGTEMGPKRDRNGTELGTEMGPKSKDRFYMGFFRYIFPRTAEGTTSAGSIRASDFHSIWVSDSGPTLPSRIYPGIT